MAYSEDGDIRKAEGAVVRHNDEIVVVHYPLDVIHRRNRRAKDCTNRNQARRKCVPNFGTARPSYLGSGYCPETITVQPKSKSDFLRTSIFATFIPGLGAPIR
jgi:hypothetical protein